MKQINIGTVTDEQYNRFQNLHAALISKLKKPLTFKDFIFNLVESKEIEIFGSKQSKIAVFEKSEKSKNVDTKRENTGRKMINTKQYGEISFLKYNIYLNEGKKIDIIEDTEDELI